MCAVLLCVQTILSLSLSLSLYKNSCASMKTLFLQPNSKIAHKHIHFLRHLNTQAELSIQCVHMHIHSESLPRLFIVFSMPTRIHTRNLSTPTPPPCLFTALSMPTHIHTQNLSTPTPPPCLFIAFSMPTHIHTRILSHPSLSISSQHSVS